MKPVDLERISEYLTDTPPFRIPLDQTGVYSFYREGPALVAELRTLRQQMERMREALREVDRQADSFDCGPDERVARIVAAPARAALAKAEAMEKGGGG